MEDHNQKVTKAKKGWRHGSSGRVPACQPQGPEIKPQYCQKKEVKTFVYQNN
jgi:hypothetical protein